MAKPLFLFTYWLVAANGPDSHFSTLKQKSVGKIAGKNLEKVSRNLLTNGFAHVIINTTKGKEIKQMLKFYYIHYTTYYKGREVGWTTARALCDESKVENFRKKVTWENLADICEELGGCACGFSIWNMKKGRQLSFSNTWPWQEPKEWKHADPQVEIECYWSERQVSIQEIMDWHDSEKAMQYLNERNLKIRG